MSDTFDFDKILKTELNLQYFTRNCRINIFNDFKRDGAKVHLWRAELLIVKEKGMTICFIMNRCLVIFLRGGKFNVVQYWWNIVAKLTSDHVIKWSGEQVITLQKAQQLKTKNFHVVPRQLFCHQCKAQFLLETDSLYWWSNKAQIVTDTDNEFTEC